MNNNIRDLYKYNTLRNNARSLCFDDCIGIACFSFIVILNNFNLNIAFTSSFLHVEYLNLMLDMMLLKSLSQTRFYDINLNVLWFWSIKLFELNKMTILEL